MPLKSIDDIVESYPWPPLSHEANYRQFLEMLLSNPSVTDPCFIAYILATVRHETAFTFGPIEEYGQGRGYPYGEPDPSTGQTYYGRGYVQLTWKANYQRFSQALGIDLVGRPELALEPATSYRITSMGMREGMFTGKKLADFTGPSGYDYLNARRIINGMDKAEKIADYARKFYSSIMPS